MFRRAIIKKVPEIPTDNHPNLDAFRYAKERTAGALGYNEDPVDAAAMPPE